MPFGPVRLIDTTLREGAQASVRYLSAARRALLARRIAGCGVAEIEVGHASPDSYGDADLGGVMEAVRREAPAVRLAIWSRGLAPDVACAARLEPDVLAFSLPASRLHVQGRLRRDFAWLPRQIDALAGQARTAGIGYLALGVEDASRAEPELLAAVADAAREAGVDRLRLADTVGVATPARIGELVTLARSRFPGAIGVHTHDDFGMATANALSALDAGATYADVSLLGLGERAGIARLEEVAGFLALVRSAPYDMVEIRALCADLAGWIGRDVPAHAPVVGADVFACESGIHVDGIAKDPRTYEPFEPAAVGARRQLRLGRQAGRGAVAAFLRERGVVLADTALVAVTVAVRAAAERVGRALTDAEFDELYGDVVRAVG